MMNKHSFISALLLLIVFFSFASSKAQLGDCVVLTPNEITVSDLDAHRAVFSWPDIGPANILIEFRTGHGAWIPVVSLAPGNTSFSLEGLEMCTDYEMRMTIACLGVLFPEPYQVIVPFSTLCCGIIYANEVEVTHITNTEIALDWVDNGATGWVVRWQKADCLGPVYSKPTMVSDITITGLEENTPYKISVNSWCMLPEPGPTSGMNYGEEFVVSTTGKRSVPSVSSTELHIAPNPFSSRTRIHVESNLVGSATLQIFDLSGKLVASPLKKEEIEAGSIELVFDGTWLPEGLYTCILTVNGEVFHKIISINR